MDHMTSTYWFNNEFCECMGFEPFPWQIRLFSLILEEPNKLQNMVCDIPTGIGKTSIISIWLMARRWSENNNETIPLHLRRLAYVVNRRTIVDQATNEAIKLANFYDHKDWDVMVSPLRGGLADNKNWKTDLKKPAIIVGTPDMVVSKLLFGGYGDGKYFRPIHAGIIGNGTMFVVDEAHLSEPLCHTLQKISAMQIEEQRKSNSNSWFKPISLIQLTATCSSNNCQKFELNDEDDGHSIIKKRLNANKKAFICDPIPISRNKTAICNEVYNRAIEFADKKTRVIIYLYDPKCAKDVCNRLGKKKHKVALLTGTIRGRERDILIKNDIIKKFSAGTKYGTDDCPLVDKTVYLVATSAGEVGWDIDSDHMICDAAPIDSMVQRFGRLNRYGNRNTNNQAQNITDNDLTYKDWLKENENISTATIIYGEDNSKKPSVFEIICTNTYDFLKSQSCSNIIQSISPSALKRFSQDPHYNYCVSIKAEPFVPNDHSINAWSMTSINDDLPLKYPLHKFIHGITDDDLYVYVAWRSEVEVLRQFDFDPTKWLHSCKLLPHELLRDKEKNVNDILKHTKDKYGDYYVIDVFNNKASIILVSELIDNPIAFHTIIFPDHINCINIHGMLDKLCKQDEDVNHDIAEHHDYTSRKRILIKNRNERDEEVIPISHTDTGFVFPNKILNELVGPDDISLLIGDNQDKIVDSTISQIITVDDHNAVVSKIAEDLCNYLDMPFANEFKCAGMYHDDGKVCDKWQRAIYNYKWENNGALAKPTRGMNVSYLGTKEDGCYRHELQSYVSFMVSSLSYCIDNNIDNELIKYLIFSHHGHGRPYFKSGASIECAILNIRQNDIRDNIVLLFDRIQSKYGYWGLAYLHAVFCSADIEGSK